MKHAVVVIVSKSKGCVTRIRTLSPSMESISWLMNFAADKGECKRGAYEAVTPFLKFNSIVNVGK